MSIKHNINIKIWEGGGGGRERGGGRGEEGGGGVEGGDDGGKDRGVCWDPPMHLSTAKQLIY